MTDISSTIPVYVSIKPLFLQGGTIIVPEEFTASLVGGGNVVAACMYDDLLFVVFEKGFTIYSAVTGAFYNSILFTDIGLDSIIAASAGSAGLYLTTPTCFALYPASLFKGYSNFFSLATTNLECGRHAVVGTTLFLTADRKIVTARLASTASNYDLMVYAKHPFVDANDLGLAILTDSVDPAYLYNPVNLGFIKKEHSVVLGRDLYNDSADFFIRDTSQALEDRFYKYPFTSYMNQIISFVYCINMVDCIVVCGKSRTNTNILAVFESIDGRLNLTDYITVTNQGELFKITDSLIALVTYVGTATVARYTVINKKLALFGTVQTITGLTISQTLYTRKFFILDSKEAIFVSNNTSTTKMIDDLQATSVTITSVAYTNLNFAATAGIYFAIRKSSSVVLYRYTGKVLSLLATDTDINHGVAAGYNTFFIQENFLYLCGGTAGHVWDISMNSLNYIQQIPKLVDMTTSTYSKCIMPRYAGDELSLVCGIYGQEGSEFTRFGRMNTTTHAFEVRKSIPKISTEEIGVLQNFYIVSSVTVVKEVSEYPPLEIAGIVDLRLGKELFVAVPSLGVYIIDVDTYEMELMTIPNSASLKQIQVSESASKASGFLMYCTDVDNGIIDLATREV